MLKIFSIGCHYNILTVCFSFCKQKDNKTTFFFANFPQNINLHYPINMYKTRAGNYCESVTPDTIPNSEVKPFSADGTLS